MKPLNAKEKLLAASLDLLVDRGYLVTTVDQLCEAAGVSKGSFYHYFESKEDLGLATLRAYYTRGMTLLMDGDFQHEADPLKRAEMFLDHTETLSPELWKKGCLLGTFAMDLADSHPRIRARLAELFDELVQALAPVFRPYENNGVTAEVVAEQYISIIEGSIVLARTYDDVTRIPKALRQFRSYLAGLKHA